MVESQPGTVVAFDPSVSLSSFSAETRDQLIFNENQLVLAKLQQPRPTQATARSRLGPDTFIEFTEYVNISGVLVYIDGSFQALVTSGVPTAPVHQIKLGFDVQVTTDTIIFWSITFVETSEIFVQYSFEDVTWFEVGAVTWVQVFDDTIENFPGDVPPTGQFRYTGTFDSGAIKARYWRIRGDAETTYVSQAGSSPNITLTVVSTDNFPSSGSLFVGLGTLTGTMTYTGKTATTFTGVDDEFLVGSLVSEVIEALTNGLGANGQYILNGFSTVGLPTEGTAILIANPSIFTEPSCLPFVNEAFSWTGKTIGTLTGVTLPGHAFTSVCGTTFKSLIDTNRYGFEFNPLINLGFGAAIYTLGDFANNVTEVHIIPTTEPLLQHWNSDGSQAVSVLVDTEDPLAAVYDKTDDAYYVIKFNDTLQGAAVDPDDDFNADTGLAFDADKWVESTTNVYFQHSTLSGTLDFKSSGGPGQLTGNYTVQGDFSAEVEFVYIGELNQGASFALEAKDSVTGNVHLSSVLRGAYIPGVSTVSGTFSGAAMTFTDTLGGNAILQDFRVDPATIDYGFPGGIIDYNLVFNGSTGAYDITVSGIDHDPAFPGVAYTMDSASFTVVNLVAPSDGQAFAVQVFVDEISVSGTLASGVALEIERAGTNAYVRYDDAATPGTFDTLFVGNMPTSDLSIQLFGDPNGQAVDILVDNYDFTGSVSFGTPVFSVITLDNQGDIVEVSGVSDSSGFAIKNLDLIRDPSAPYNSFLAPRIAIATNGAAAGAGGELYLKINDTLYRYLKTTLPLLSVEDGSSAVATSTGEIPITGVTGFAYNGYTQGGLSYIEYDSDLSGTFLKTIRTSDLTAVPLKALLDVASINYPFAWNVSDLATLYFVDGTALKLYDLNETKAGFVNVTSDKQVLSAGTAETATVTAQVLNVYGEPKSSKYMTFTVSAGDGALSPAAGCSDGNGEDTTVYTVGAAVGTATITVTVSDVSC